jgi:hypothetical protein
MRGWNLIKRLCKVQLWQRIERTLETATKEREQKHNQGAEQDVRKPVNGHWTAVQRSIESVKTWIISSPGEALTLVQAKISYFIESKLFLE